MTFITYYVNTTMIRIPLKYYIIHTILYKTVNAYVFDFIED